MKNRTAQVVAAVTTMAVTLAVTATNAQAQVPDADVATLAKWILGGAK